MCVSNVQPGVAPTYKMAMWAKSFGVFAAAGIAAQAGIVCIHSIQYILSKCPCLTARWGKQERWLVEVLGVATWSAKLYNTQQQVKHKKERILSLHVRKYRCERWEDVKGYQFRRKLRPPNMVTAQYNVPNTATSFTHVWDVVLYCFHVRWPPPPAELFPLQRCTS